MTERRDGEPSSGWSATCDPPSDEAPGNVLIVDDVPDNLRLLLATLRDHGYVVRVAPTGALALQAVEKDPPDLVLLDISMPAMDGYEVCARLKQNELTREIPVIFLSALNEPFDKVKAFAVGGVDYISKPFHLEEVETRVKTHLGLRRMRARLERSYARLQELEGLRDSLVHMVVHDMKSPLAAIASSLDFLKQDLAGRIDGDSLGDLARASLAAQRLLQMANDLLDVSRLEAGQMPLERGECDLRDVVGAAIESVRAMAPDREVTLVAPDPVRGTWDAQVIGRVVENLTSNGLKHTPAGRALALSVSERDGGARVEVRDEGPGIPAEHRERLFEKFGTLMARRDRKYHSTGLGLAFCKLAVEAHGGEIGVVSAEGAGSTFWFVVPCAPPEA
jgi:signal transduction histidine kinase